MKKKKKKKHLKFSGLIFILLFLYLIGMLGYYAFTLPVKSITVRGNQLLTENEIINAANVDVDTPFFKTSAIKIRKNIEKMPLAEEVVVRRNFLDFKFTIEVKESKILFLNVLNDKLILDGGKELLDDNRYMGFPTFVNYVPEKIYKKFIKAFAKTNDDTIKMISEIEYNPDKYNDVVLDDERFLLRMNDGNQIYINIVNIDKLNKYQSIYSGLKEKGILYLDSSNENYIFETYAMINSKEKNEN